MNADKERPDKKSAAACSKKCPQCGLDVAADAVRCPRCHALLLRACTGACLSCSVAGCGARKA